MIKNIVLAFIPIFVAVDAIGVLPIFVSLTEDIDRKEKIKVISRSIITASCLAISFIFIGKFVFKLLGITMGDFMVAGGFLLFAISITDIMTVTKKTRIPVNELGAVPLGTPLIAGPAVLTTSLVIVTEYGLIETMVSVLINIILAGVIFSFSDVIIKMLGISGTRALSKVMSLLLAAIAVMLIRKGIMYVFLIQHQQKEII
jgi:multiple antibiotic resistance protein